MRNRSQEHFRANKLLGQHFLTSPEVLAQIVTSANLSPDDIVLEIGSGLGTLTRELARRVKNVVAVEKDLRLATRLRGELEREGVRNVTLISSDILTFIPTRCSLLNAHYKVVANIPYYLTGRLIRKFLETEHHPTEMLLMMQKEVAERVCTKPPRMSILTVSVQAFAKPEILFIAPRGAFSPRPAVDSAFVRIGNISRLFFETHRITPNQFFETVRSGFRTRRKTLANNLGEYLGNKKAAEALIAQCGIDPKRRPETLPLSEWALLAHAIRAPEKRSHAA